MCLHDCHYKDFLTLMKRMCNICSFSVQHLQFGHIPDWLQLCLAPQSMPASPGSAANKRSESIPGNAGTQFRVQTAVCYAALAKLEMHKESFPSIHFTISSKVNAREYLILKEKERKKKKEEKERKGFSHNLVPYEAGSPAPFLRP